MTITRLTCTSCRRTRLLDEQASGTFCYCKNGIYVPEATLKADDQWVRQQRKQGNWQPFMGQEFDNEAGR